MKSTRQAGRKGLVLARIAGYGGTLALVAAAVAVLLWPVLGKDGGVPSPGGRAAAGTSSAPAASQPVPPVSDAPGAVGPEPRQSRGSSPGAGGGQGQVGGPPMPGQGGGTLTWCPAGTAFYRATADALEVTVHVSASGLVRAEVSLRGRSPVSQQDTATAGRPHSFRFRGVTAPLVERVKVTTVSLGMAMQTCYARPGQ